MKFEPHGPFELPRSDGEINMTHKKKFWATVEEDTPSLSDAVGCYIFALKAAKGYTPWYVGMTRKRSFKGETWQPHKLLGYGKVIRAHKGTPMLFLLAKLTPNWFPVLQRQSQRLNFAKYSLGVHPRSSWELFWAINEQVAVVRETNRYDAP
ncbi:MAG TPA: hypothetical protein VHX60_04015 [Acidobacteriaceae bacterium]|jgi:hypothetical protein|nr:hypothetical protein [Acidobacteriaceae bacterium]